MIQQDQLRQTLDVDCGKFSLNLSERTYLMGVLNRTPDSFSDGGLFTEEDVALKRIEEMVLDGADIIDIGGESTRPGAEEVSVERELERVIPLIRKSSRIFDVPISIDTRKAQVAEEALKNGACIVNDITGLKGDRDMAQVVARYDAVCVAMHIKGTPRTMQDNPTYGNLISEIITSLEGSIEIATKGGVAREKVIIDPGIGFGKTVEHNLEILNRLDELKVLSRPILIGVSRKSFIGRVLDREVNDRIFGTAAASAIAIMNGANIIRIHDVREMIDVARMSDRIARGRAM